MSTLRDILNTHPVKNLKKEELEWHSNPLQTERATYEVYVESDKESSK